MSTDTARLRELLAAANARRWLADGHGSVMTGEAIVDMESVADADLVVFAVNALPALLDELDRARRLLREIADDGYGTALGTLERIRAFLADPSQEGR